MIAYQLYEFYLLEGDKKHLLPHLVMHGDSKKTLKKQLMQHFGVRSSMIQVNYGGKAGAVMIKSGRLIITARRI